MTKCRCSSFAPYPWQASIPVEAVRGKEVKFDVAQPYALMGGGFGTEDPTLTESDFEMKTRSDIVKYSYVTGRVTDAAMKEGATAYPPRDYWSIASENAVNSSRSIRERSMLGVTRNPQTIASNNVYEAATSLEYDGIHQMITRSTGAYSTWTNNLAQTAPITSVDTAAQAIVKLEDQLVQSAQKLLVMGIQPNLMMCDMSTFSLFREAYEDSVRCTSDRRLCIRYLVHPVCTPRNAYPESYPASVPPIHCWKPCNLSC